ncbi:MAG: hypothetical protein ACI8QS_001119 [Planctomycetota bacterium]|jgi:hypothetical protein
MASAPKSTNRKALLGLAIALLVLLARQMGWISPEEGGSGQAGDPGQGIPSSEAAENSSSPGQGSDTLAEDSAREIARLFKAQYSDVQVLGSGMVRALLPDDNDAPRHQKFILEMSNGMTLLVSHNIDLAPRVPLDKGDTIGFNGEYEYTDKGGVLHWTHHDPGGRHEGGWLELDGRRYE